MDVNINISHWYDLNPSRLEMEKIAMSLHFPNFELRKELDGFLYWVGTLKSEHFKRIEGYNVKVEYSNGGTENHWCPGIIITPISPSYDELFSIGSSLSDKLQRALLNDVAIDMKCVGYEDPATVDNPTIITGATLLRKTIDLLTRYGEEKECLEQKAKASADAATRKRHELKQRLLNSGTITISKSEDVCEYISTTEVIESDFSAGEIEHIERSLKQFRDKCKSYFELLPEEEHTLSEEDDETLKKIVSSEGFDWSNSDIKFPLRPSIHPLLIIRDFKYHISIKKGLDMVIYHFHLPGGGYYAFNSDCLVFPFEAHSLILFYFIKNATAFCLPLIWHSGYGRKTLVLSQCDKPTESFLQKDINTEKITQMPYGIEIPRIEENNTFRFNYFYWHAWTGYVKCSVCITKLKDLPLLCGTDIKIEESTHIMYHYNCHVIY